jgi:pimeloyl-ACP methyl ester carboxylesterase
VGNGSGVAAAAGQPGGWFEFTSSPKVYDGEVNKAARSLVASTVVAAALIVAAAYAQAGNDHASTGPPPPRFATVNGVRLHYLDWGGKGAALLFLTALGGTAADFQPLAIHFSDRFHVLGLTRRGQGQSDKPDTGYDTSTLVRDIKAFLDQRKITRATLVGYSLAGNELTEFATLYPQRVIKLVYLDAAYDLPRNAELGRKAHLDLPPLPGADNATLALIARSNEYRPDYTRIGAPALGFFVTYDEAPKSTIWDDATKAKLLAYWNDYGKAYRREQIDRFQKDMKKGRVVELHNTTHGGFVFDKEQQKTLIREMRAFLSNSPSR